MRDYNALNERISDYTRCPHCVDENRLGYAQAYFNYDESLYGVCPDHATKWYVSRALWHPEIPDLTRYQNLTCAFRTVAPVLDRPKTAVPRPVGARSAPGPRVHAPDNSRAPTARVAGAANNANLALLRAPAQTR